VRRIHDREVGVEREIDWRASGMFRLPGLRRGSFSPSNKRNSFRRVVAVARQHTEGIGELAEAPAAIVPLMTPVCELIDESGRQIPMTEYVSVVP